MPENISPGEMGKKITELRKKKNLSQDDIAKFLDIPRSSVTQIELGNRTLSATELIILSKVLGFSLDEFISKGVKKEPFQIVDEEKAETKNEERISVPTLKVKKFKNILLYILERCAGKPNMGETVLYKLLYFCDFNYYELYEEHLTGSIYRKLPYGPVPQKLDTIITGMIESNQLKKIKTDYHGFPQTRYMPLEKANLTQLSAAEKTVIDNVIEQMSDWNASRISEYSHKDMPWLATDEGNTISYNLAFYRELPYSVRMYDEDEK